MSKRRKGAALLMLGMKNEYYDTCNELCLVWKWKCIPFLPKVPLMHAYLSLSGCSYFWFLLFLAFCRKTALLQDFETSQGGGLAWERERMGERPASTTAIMSISAAEADLSLSDWMILETDRNRHRDMTTHAHLQSSLYSISAPITSPLPLLPS